MKQANTSRPKASTALRARRRQTVRRGGVFFEMAVCCGLLVLIMAAVAQTSVGFLQQQRTASLREIALLEAANLLDQSQSVVYADLSPDKLQTDIKLGAGYSSLTRVEWSVLDKDEEGLKAKRIDCAVHWESRGLARREQLSMWRFAPQDAPAEADAKEEAVE